MKKKIVQKINKFFIYIKNIKSDNESSTEI